MTKITCIQGDITQLAVDAIVNAANEALLGGGGLDGQVHFKAGPDLLEACRLLNGCKKGEAKITRGYRLPAKNIIHTVAPIFGVERGREEEILENCYRNTLELAKAHGIKTIAFPSLGTGYYHFPKDKAAMIAMKTVKDYISLFPDTFDEISFVLFSDLDFKIYNILIQENAQEITLESLV